MIWRLRALGVFVATALVVTAATYLGYVGFRDPISPQGIAGLACSMALWALLWRLWSHSPADVRPFIVGDDGETMCQFCYRPFRTTVYAHGRSLWRWALRRPRRSVRSCDSCVPSAVSYVRAHR